MCTNLEAQCSARLALQLIHSLRLGLALLSAATCSRVASVHCMYYFLLTPQYTLSAGTSEVLTRLFFLTAGLAGVAGS